MSNLAPFRSSLRSARLPVLSRTLRRSALALTLALAGLGQHASAAEGVVLDTSTDPASFTASRDRIAEDLRYLSSDELAGRDTGSEGIQKAGEYIATRFKELGFNTELYDGTPFQAFSALQESEAGTADENKLVVKVGDSEFAYELDQALRPLALGGSGQITAPLVFAGYGITAPDNGYDDYAGLDVKGKIVMILRGQPRAGRDDNPLGGRRDSRFAFFTTKVQNAIEHGAAAVLLVNHARAAEELVSGLQRRLTEEQQNLEQTQASLASLPEEAANSREQLEGNARVAESQIASLKAELEAAPQALLATSQAGRANAENTIPVVSLGRLAANQLLVASRQADGENPLATIEAKIDETFQPTSFELANSTATLDAKVVTRDIIGRNVIAEFPGTGDLADETVVIGAHYDHVGMGGAGSLAPGTIEIHNGADDNGSGTVTMLETAYRLSKLDVPSRRRIVFMAFTAEEKGLLGSKHYAREPRFPLEQTTGMINLDMVGRLNDDEMLTVFGTGTSPNFDGLVDQWTEKFGLPVRKDPSGYGPSDHTSFYEQKVPVLFFFTGLHPDYHRPTDDFEKINLDGMVRITDMVCEAAVYLATVPDRPPFQTTGPGAGVRPAAFLGVGMTTQDGKVMVSEVVPDGPAAKAGFRVGDQIVEIDGTKPAALEEVQNVVSGKRPGRELTVVLGRNGDQITVTVKLAVRP